MVAVLLGASSGARRRGPACHRPRCCRGPRRRTLGEDRSAAPSSGACRALARPPRTAGRVVSTVAMGKGIRFNNPTGLNAARRYSGYPHSRAGVPRSRGRARAGGRPTASSTAGRCILGRRRRRPRSRSRRATSSLTAAARACSGTRRLGAAIARARRRERRRPSLALGLGYYPLAGVALSGEIVGDLFYGAATYDAAYTVYPDRLGAARAHDRSSSFHELAGARAARRRHGEGDRPAWRRRCCCVALRAGGRGHRQPAGEAPEELDPYNGILRPEGADRLRPVRRVLTQRTRACDAADPPRAAPELPAGCYPLVRDGEVCLHKRSSSRAATSTALHVAGEGASTPTRCNFAHWKRRHERAWRESPPADALRASAPDVLVHGARRGPVRDTPRSRRSWRAATTTTRRTGRRAMSRTLEGRLAAASTYLERHPRGAFAGEVRAYTHACRADLAAQRSAGRPRASPRTSRRCPGARSAIRRPTGCASSSASATPATSSRAPLRRPEAQLATQRAERARIGEEVPRGCAGSWTGGPGGGLAEGAGGGDRPVQPGASASPLRARRRARGPGRGGLRGRIRSGSS